MVRLHGLEPPLLAPSARVQAKLLGPGALVVYPRTPLDRSCLGSTPRVYARGQLYAGDEHDLAAALAFVNTLCGTYAALDGVPDVRARILGALPQRMYRVQPGDACPRVHHLSREAFLRDFVAQSRPVIIERAAAHW